MSNDRKTGVRSLVTATTALGLLASWGTQLQAEDLITSNVTVKCKRTLSDAEHRALSLAATRILKHTDQARTAIADKNNAEAAENIDKALTLVGLVERAAPRYHVKAEIRSGDIVYQDEDEEISYYVPIYDELDKVDVVGPVVRASKEHASTSNDSEAVRASALEFTAVKLDVRLAKTALETAKKDLHDGKLGDADEALRAVQTNVILEVETAKLPLVRAADNVKLAQYELQEGHQEKARAALNEASDALQEYQRDAGKHRAAEVKQLRQEIEQLTASLHQNSSEAKGMISSWWDRLVKWF